MTECIYCSSENTIRNGFRKNKSDRKQIFRCKDCGRKFVDDIGLGGLRKKDVIEMVLLLKHNEGLSGNEIKKKLDEEKNIIISQPTISRWTRKYKIPPSNEIKKKLYEEKKIISQPTITCIRKYEISPIDEIIKKYTFLDLIPKIYFTPLEKELYTTDIEEKVFSIFTNYIKDLLVSFERNRPFKHILSEYEPIREKKFKELVNEASHYFWEIKKTPTKHSIKQYLEDKNIL